MPCSQAPSHDEDLFKPGNKAAVQVCAPTRILITIQSALSCAKRSLSSPSKRS
jgi:hypothetical protein